MTEEGRVKTKRAQEEENTEDERTEKKTDKRKKRLKGHSLALTSSTQGPKE